MTPHPDDVIIWPDLTWCFRSELAEYQPMSDDYMIVFTISSSYEEVLAILSDK